MKYRFFCMSLVLFGELLLGISISAERSEVLFQQANLKYRQLLSQKQSIPKEKWLHLIREFEHIQKSFPAHPQAAYSIFRAGQLYRQLFQITHQEKYIDRSLRTFRQLIKTYPQTTLADDSQYLIGKIFEKDKKEPNLALLEYNKVLKYNGDQKNNALKKIKQLQKNSPSTFQLLTLPKEGTHFSQKRQGGISIDHSRSLPKAQILSVRYWATAKWARVVISSSRPIPYLYGDLPVPLLKTTKHSRRFYIDLLDSQLATQVNASLKEEDRFIHDVEFKPLNPRITRLTFSLDKPASLKVFDYEVSQQNTITLEIIPAKKEHSVALLKIPEKQTVSPDFTKRTIKRIIIDPGHGGIDPGASGFGVHEKDIVLAIGKELKSIIENKTSLDVFLTRNTDRFVSLEERSALARQYKGDLFISLHVNAHSIQEVQGIESYYLNVTEDKASMKLAIRENNMSNRGLQNFSAILRDLLNLSQSSQSAILTHSIHTQLLQNIHNQYGSTPRNLGIKEAPFLILLGVGMPATLLEISFISNPEENRRLQQKKYHRIVSEGIFQGIQDYILQQKQG